ncbi:MAG: cyclase, partial [Mycobacterium sp.]
LWKYVVSIPLGALPADATAMRETAEALRIAESSSDDFILYMGRLSRGLVLVSRDGPEREAGLDLFAQARNAAVTAHFSLSALTIVDPEFAMEKARSGDLDGAIEMVRAVVDGAYESGDMIWRGRATEVLVQLLIRRGTVGDQHEAQAAIDRLSLVSTDPGFVLHELPLLRSRALLALARADENSYRNFLEQHRAKAAAAGFDALMATADSTVLAPQRDSAAQ